MFRVILGVTVESVQGNQVYLEWIVILGYFGMVAQPPEFLSTFKVRLPPRVVTVREYSFPDEAGKWMLISR